MICFVSYLKINISTWLLFDKLVHASDNRKRSLSIFPRVNVHTKIQIVSLLKIIFSTTKAGSGLTSRQFTSPRLTIPNLQGYFRLFVWTVYRSFGLKLFVLVTFILAIFLSDIVRQMSHIIFLYMYVVSTRMSDYVILNRFSDWWRRYCSTLNRSFCNNSNATIHRCMT